jgi:arylsulfatase A-like enzyme
LLLLLAPQLRAESKPLNVLFLFSDDHRADAIAALGHPVVKTPTLDSLLANGFHFPNAYCFGSNSPAVCLPSRNMLLSGRAYFRYKGAQSPADGPNWPLTMQKAGYETYHYGKSGNVANLIQKTFQHNLTLADEKERRSGTPGKTVTDGAIAFLEKRKMDKPFFMYLAYETPHDPRVASKELMALYDREKMPLPKNFRAVHPFDNGEMTVRDEKLASWPRTEKEIRGHLHDYYAVITGLDRQLGRLLETLDRLKLRESTLILYSSDHGLAMGSHGLMGKQNLYEDGMRVPLIFSGPGIKQGRSEALVYLFDLFPTVCDFTTAKKPEKIDGKSLKAILDGKQKTVRENLFTTYRGVQKALRDERWKIIRYPQVNKTQLFDLKDDPHEMHDLADKPEHKERLAKMLEQLAAAQNEYGDSTPLTVAKPKNPTFVPPEK